MPLGLEGPQAAAPAQLAARAPPVKPFAAGQRWGRAAPARRSSVTAPARILGTTVTDYETGVESLVLKKGAPVPKVGFANAAWDGYEGATW